MVDTPAPRPTRLVNWHELAWHELAVVFGIQALVVPPVGLAALVPTWVLWWWIGSLFVSGATGVAGVVMSSPLRALALDRFALWMQAGTLLQVTVASVFFRGWAGVFGLGLYRSEE